MDNPPPGSPEGQEPAGNKAPQGDGKPNNEITNKLSDLEARSFAECEAIISKGWESVLDVGRALTTIRDQRLYREAYATFELYCREKLEYSKTHANRLIVAARVVDIVTPVGVKLVSESQARPLAGLPPAQLQKAARRALKLAGSGKLTAKHVEQAARELAKRPKTGSARTKPVSAAERFKAALELIEKAEKAASVKNMQLLNQLLAKLRACLSAT